MNKQLDLLHPYPFQRLNQLLSGITPPKKLPLINWSLGEPRHPAPDFLVAALQDEKLIRQSFNTYPPTRGLPELRQAIATFIERRYQAPMDPETRILPVNGTREALFAIAQAVVNSRSQASVLMPNPCYQIYEGAAILAGAKPVYLNCTAETDYLPDFERVSEATWRSCELLYLCSPGNPTGAVMQGSDMQKAIELSDRYDFVIVSDECYSEIYLDEARPPPGLLTAARDMGRDDYRNCVAVNSLSKRSNLPGLRSGYVAGDADIISKFLHYRTYHGSAMPLHHQRISELAWRDEAHVKASRESYRTKFKAVTDLLNKVWPMTTPAAGFYLWPETPVDDADFALRLAELTNVRVLPGSFLSRDTEDGNPGSQRVRMALVSTLEESTEAANRIVDCWQQLQGSADFSPGRPGPG